MLFLPYFLTKTLAEHITVFYGQRWGRRKKKEGRLNLWAKTIQTHIPVYTGNAIKAIQEHFLWVISSKLRQRTPSMGTKAWLEHCDWYAARQSQLESLRQRFIHLNLSSSSWHTVTIKTYFTFLNLKLKINIISRK